MTIFNRFVKLCKADIHGVMDQMEDKGLLLKQYIREMEESLGKKQIQLKKLKTSREKTKKDHESHVRELEKLESDITTAVERKKDDIARMMIRKKKTLLIYIEEFCRHIERQEDEITQLDECIKEQQLRYENLNLRVSGYFRNKELNEMENNICRTFPNAVESTVSDEEIELELINRKESLKGGGSI